MRIPLSPSLCLLAVMLCPSTEAAHLPPLPLEGARAEFREPQRVVEAFLKSVDRGELVVFGRKPDRSMITPARVEYVYELDSRVPIIRSYSRLNQGLSVPEMADCPVQGISSTLGSNGHIVDTEFHVWPIKD